MIKYSITSPLDYCNSPLYITPVLKDLHWQPLEQRIEYKVLSIIYKALHGKSLAYISHSLSLYTPTRSLWSENTISPECQDAVWKSLADAVFRMPLHPFGTLSLPTPVKRTFFRMSGSHFIMQKSKFLLIDATAVTLGQGHGKVILYILPDLYIL